MAGQAAHAALHQSRAYGASLQEGSFENQDDPAQDLHKLGVQEGDLLHMDNTVQMHKPVPQASKWRSVVFVHDHWKQRLYYLPTEETGVKERLRAKQVQRFTLIARVIQYCRACSSLSAVKFTSCKPGRKLHAGERGWTVQA